MKNNLKKYNLQASELDYLVSFCFVFRFWFWFLRDVCGGGRINKIIVGNVSENAEHSEYTGAEIWEPSPSFKMFFSSSLSERNTGRGSWEEEK